MTDDRPHAFHSGPPIAAVPWVDPSPEPGDVRQESRRRRVERAPHLRAFGFQRDPFPVVPDTEGFYLSRPSEAIVAEILHAIESRKGFLVLTGEVGLGKTTLSRRILMELEDRGIRTALVFNTFHEGADLLSEINRDFGVEAPAGDLQAQMSELNRFLLRNLAAGVNCALIIDDAQQLSVESLELVRQVSNLETDSEKLLQIVLVGQPELEEKLESYELRQLASRIALRHRVEPFTLEETRQYVQFKLMQAGGHGRLQVSPAAFPLLHRASGGNPRQINLLMDRCLYGAIAVGSEKIDKKLLARAAREVRSSSAPESKLSRKRVALSVALLLLVAALVVVLVNPSLAREVRDTATAWTSAQGLGPQVVVDADEATPPPSAAEAAVEPAVEPAAPAELSAPTTTEPVVRLELVGGREPEPLDLFLAAYGLEGYRSELAEAIQQGSMDRVGARIRLATGLRLVSLPVLPEGVTAPILGIADPQDETTRYVLFWRPTIWGAENFYFQYRPFEVGALQRALWTLGHYEGEIDGLAGPQTSTALRSFQKSMGLDPSGLADTATLFLLELQAGVPEPATAGAASSPEPTTEGGLPPSD